jgi:hypothetical protein
MHVVEVRDVAAVIAAVLMAGRGPRRYVVPGHHVDAVSCSPPLPRAPADGCPT